MINKTIEIYTDGSCDTELKTGSWAAILLIDQEEIIINGIVTGTSHNRMELLAVLKAFEFLQSHNIESDTINVYSDSQYVVNLRERKDKLIRNKFLTKNHLPIQNVDLVQMVIQLIERYPVTFIKVKAHQRQQESLNYNRKVDRIVRSILRERIKKSKRN